MWKCPPSTVLVPVDFGDASGRALAVASALASRVDARVVVLHVETIDVPPYFTREQFAMIERERRTARTKAELFLRESAKRHGIEACDAVIANGSPTAAIVEAARGADLVVMGTHGRRGPSRWWLGSVAERVVHDCGTPVLVVRAALGGVAPGAIFDRPLVVSPTGAEDIALRVATGLARAFGGTVGDTIVTCQSDLAQEEHATLVVVSKTASLHGVLFGHSAEQWLRSCTLPMLFVPSATT
jgi:nucleotide-binding universal stress UspA family protein